MRRPPWVAFAAPLLACVPACGPSPNVSGSTDVACRPLTVTAAHRAPGFAGTVFTLVMENRSRGQILGNLDAPFINALASGNAIAGGYHDAYVHPSEPNYLWMVAGENFGILSDNDPGPSNIIDARGHIVNQIEQAGLTWRAYAESMGKPCTLTSHGDYAARHVPFLFFADIDGWDGARFEPSARCDAHVVDYAQLDADLAAGTLPDYVFITPNLAHDMHNGTMQAGDAWASVQVPKKSWPHRPSRTAASCSSCGMKARMTRTTLRSSSRHPTPATVTSRRRLTTRAPTCSRSRPSSASNPLPCSAHPAATSPMRDLFATALPSLPILDGGAAGP